MPPFFDFNTGKKDEPAIENKPLERPPQDTEVNKEELWEQVKNISKPKYPKQWENK